MIAWIKEHCRGDRFIWFIFVFLVVVSFISVSSASTAYAYQEKHGDVIGVTMKHGFFLVIGLLAGGILSNMHPKYFNAFSGFVLFVSVALLLYAMFGGTTVNGSARWIYVYGYTFQPSEAVKISLVLYVSRLLAKNVEKPDMAFWPIVIVTGVICAMVMRENLSTAMLIGVTILSLMILGRISLYKLFAIGMALLLLLSLVVYFSEYTKVVMPRAQTWHARVDRWWNNAAEVDSDDHDDFQAEQALTAVASGGLMGKGIGKSYIKNILPMAYSDFIFAIILEECGVWGMALVLLCYCFLLLRAWQISRRSEKAFHIYAMLGLAILISYQALINMAVGVGLIPVTGQTLPMVSMGGSSNVLIGAAFGIMLSISAQSEKKQKEALAEPMTSGMEDVEQDEELYEERKLS